MYSSYCSYLGEHARRKTLPYNLHSKCSKYLHYSEYVLRTAVELYYVLSRAGEGAISDGILEIKAGKAQIPISNDTILSLYRYKK